MKRTIGIACFLAAVTLLAACGDEDGFVISEKGPDMTVKSCDNSAYMGSDVAFSVDLQDVVPLSTLKAQLFFDETMVREVTIRTKEYGTYDGKINVPLLKGIPDGTATLKFISQNIQFGLTEQTLTVDLKRPDFTSLTLRIGDREYPMSRKEGYRYEYTGSLPADASAKVVTPAVNDRGEVITLGWDGSAVQVDGSYDIPYSMPNPGTYTIGIDLMELSADPFGTIKLNITENSATLVTNLVQGAKLDLSSIPGVGLWDLDYDFFDVAADNTVTFKAVNGLYRLAADYSKRFIKVEAMKDGDHTDTFDPATGEGSLWIIGAGMGKPTVGPSWNTDDGAWCMAKTAPGIFSITFVAGASIAPTGYSIKAFGQKGWGVELGGGAYSKNNSPELVKITGSGNIEPADEVSLQTGKAYRFTIDITGGSAVLSVEQVDIPVNALDIKVNGVQADKLSATVYRLASLDLKKGDAITIEGIANLQDWYLDPDYLYFDGAVRFNAVDGKYSVDLHLDGNCMAIRKLKADGSEGELGDGALWLMAWGFANPVMTRQIGFTPGAAWCMAQVEPMVFQFTGTAVEETDGTTVGGRVRFDYISAKLFYQDGWGGEMKVLTFTDRAKALLSQTGSGANLELAADVKLEKGATYVLRVDCSGGTASGASYTGDMIVDFYKK